MSRFFLQCPGIIACFPEKFPSVQFPGEISRLQEQFWLCTETAFARLVTPIKLTKEKTKEKRHSSEKMAWRG